MHDYLREVIGDLKIRLIMIIKSEIGLYQKKGKKARRSHQGRMSFSW